ncbi:MAG: ABC transporter ATP-binding protein, partial [Acidisphaera sp.]|nr:ABC transporter ATP-binding protein [Acidisphaera sp.]
MSWLRLERLSKLYGTAPVVDAMSLDVVQGEMVVLLGPSGCGKTTTLRMIAGFVQASSGDIALDGQSILRLPAHRREMGIVFQSYALFPHLSVARNVAFGLEMRREPRAAIAARVQDMLRLVQLEPLADRLPRELSGGQQQRVALARALAIRPKILLLDEPLSNLDAALRLEVGRDIRILQRDGGLTALMVTHDQDEAMAMADRLVVMKDGRVQQIGTQQDLYERPANPFVAAFIGRSNMLPGMQVDPTHMVLEGGVRVTFAGRYGGAGACTLALRPERLRLGQPGPARGGRPDVGWVDGTVELSTYLGAVLEHVVRVTPQLRLVVRGGSAGRPTLHPP